MKKLCALAAIATLAACDQSAPPAEEAAETPAMEVTTPVIQPGLYSVGDETTAYGTTRLNEDGTYVDYGENDEVVGGGTWRTSADLLCFDPEGDGEEEQENCWANEPAGEDGSFRTTRDDGSQSYLVTPIAEEDGEAEGAAE